MPESRSACPCGLLDARGRSVGFADCCGRFLEPVHTIAAADALSLMRSRYSAFVLGHTDYLLTTWHPDTRPAALQLDPSLKWLGLRVLQHLNLDATHAQVEFIARSRGHSGRAQRQHERSRFTRVNGVWLYVDGDRL